MTMDKVIAMLNSQAVSFLRVCFFNLLQASCALCEIRAGLILLWG